MKKYFLTMATLALFAIGFVASDEDESSSSENANSTPQTEQKQEAEAERQEREQKEKIDKLESKKKEIAEEGYKHGYKAGFSCNYHEYETFHWDRMARQDYTAWHEAPTSSEEKELYQIFQDNYLRGVEEGYKAQN